MQALDEMIRVNKNKKRFITLVLEKGRFEKLPINNSDLRIFNDYLEGMKLIGCPIQNEGDYIENLFIKREINLKRHELLLENKNLITDGFIQLWERSFTEQSYKEMMENSMGFYLQFLKRIGWTKQKLITFIEEEYSLQNTIDFYREHLGEELIQSTPIILLEST